MPFLIRTLMISALLTVSFSERSLTTTGFGSSTGPVGRAAAACASATAAAAPVRLRCGRGGRRGRYLRGGIVHLEFDQCRRALDAERSPDGRRSLLGVSAAGFVTEIGSAPRQPSGGVALDRPARRADQPVHLALGARDAADRAGAGRYVIRSSLR